MGRGLGFWLYFHVWFGCGVHGIEDGTLIGLLIFGIEPAGETTGFEFFEIGEGSVELILLGGHIA